MRLLKNFSNKYGEEISNISWVSIEKFVKIFTSLLVTGLIARYLGIELFGIYAFALTFVTLFGSLTVFGTNSVVVNELVIRKKDTNKILSSAFILHLIGGTLSFLLCLVLAIFFEKEYLPELIFILSIGFFFQSCFVVRYFCEAFLVFRKIVFFEVLVLFLGASLKVYFIFIKLDVISLAIATVIETLALFIIYLSQFKKRIHKQFRFIINKSELMLLANKSWPYIIGGVAMAIFLRTDQIMVSALLSNKDLGIISSALRLNEIIFLIGIIITSSITQRALKKRNENYNEYLKLIRQNFVILSAVGVLIAIFCTLFSDFIIQIIFGTQYSESGVYLMYYSWISVIFFGGLVSDRWYLAENQQKIRLAKMLIGLGSNVFLNYYLINKFGLIGAPLASLISLLIAYVLFDLFKWPVKGFFYTILFKIKHNAKIP